MKIINVETDLIDILKTKIIKRVIADNRQYVEMENEILIDTNILIRLKEKVGINFDAFELSKMLEDNFVTEYIEKEKVPKYTKKQNHNYSKMVNNKIKRMNRR